VHVQQPKGHQLERGMDSNCYYCTQLFILKVIFDS